MILLISYTLLSIILHNINSTHTVILYRGDTTGGGVRCYYFFLGVFLLLASFVGGTDICWPCVSPLPTLCLRRAYHNVILLFFVSRLGWRGGRRGVGKGDALGSRTHETQRRCSFKAGKGRGLFFYFFIFFLSVCLSVCFIPGTW